MYYITNNKIMQILFYTQKFDDKVINLHLRRFHLETIFTIYELSLCFGGIGGRTVTHR